MPLEEFKIKLVRNKNSSGMDSLLYSIYYKVNSKRPYYPSYKILTALAGQSEVFIELNSDLISGVQYGKHEYVKHFLDVISSAFDLEYRSRIVPSAQKPSILGFFFEPQKRPEADELVVHIPNHIWTEEKFKEILPVNGAKYYITKGSAGGQKILDSFWSMTEEEKADTFKFILFDNAFFGIMGIYVNCLGENELRGLLGLSK